MSKIISNSAKVDEQLRQAGFKVLVLFSIIISLVMAIAVPDNILVASAFPLCWFGISILALACPRYSNICAKVWVLFSLPMALLLVLFNGLLPATLISTATILPVMLTKGTWRIVSVSLIGGLTFLVPFSGLDYDTGIWLRLSVTNIFVAIMVYSLARFLEKALVDSLDKSDALALALKGQRKANEVQSVFLATMSHEIRTPMNGVLGLVDIVLSSKITENQRPKIERIQYAGITLNKILNDILDYSKLNAGKLGIENIPVDITKIISETAFLFQKAIEEKEISYHCDIDKTLNMALISDPTRISQILNNVVSNALKFTPNGGSVSLTLKVIRDTQSDQEIEFCVADSGIGIPDNRLQDIFCSFVQANTSTTRTHGGTGLGLQISKSIVNILDGSIWVTSKEGLGSEFFFRLNLAKPKQALLNPVRKTSEDSHQFEGKVLVVEDNEINQIVISEMLKSYGLTIELANDGLQAVEALNNKHFDLVLMDLQMPNMDGFDATKAIRLNDPQTPIVAVSASVLKEDVEKTVSVGMNSHIGKPIVRSVLLAVLYQYINTK